jgi:phage shock protein B
MRNVFRFLAWLAILTLAVPFLLLSLPVLLVWASIRLCGDGFRPNRAQLDDETQLMQKIHSDLVRMDQRVEALETLLLEDSYSRPEPRSYV